MTAKARSPWMSSRKGAERTRWRARPRRGFLARVQTGAPDVGLVTAKPRSFACRPDTEIMGKLKHRA